MAEFGKPKCSVSGYQPLFREMQALT